MASMDEHELAKQLHDHRGDPDEWEDTPTRVKVQPARSEVVSFRLPSDQLDLVERLASEAGQSVSELLRSAVLAFIRGETLEPVLEIHSGSSGRLQLTLRTTLRGAGFTHAEPADWVPDEPFPTVTCLD
jgi:hypothetical protein